MATLATGMLHDDFVAARLPAPGLCPPLDCAALGYPARMNAAVELLDAAVLAGEGARPAIRTAHGDLSYADVRRASDRIAHVLVNDMGLAPGNRVLLRGPNTAMLIACWFGVLKAGGVVVTTMPMLRERELRPILAKAAVTHALVDSRCLDEFTGPAAEHGVAHVLTYDGDAGTGELERRCAARPRPFAAHVGPSDAPALIAFTSGTTGEPKGCVHDHRAILAPADTYARHVLRPEPGEVWCGSPPIAFTFGLGALVMFPFRHLGVSVPLENGSPPKLLEAVERFGVTMLFTAPTAYKAMLKDLDPARVATLKTCVSAGEHLPPAVHAAWEAATGRTLLNGIGATEMMHIFISNTPEDARPGATGRVVPGYQACVLDDDGTPLMEGTGRLAVRGPTGCRYLDDPRQAIYVRDGWNVTGDTYRLDADGVFWYLARSDDMIVSSGYNIAAPEVENALLEHAAVSECAVVGAPCPDRGHIVKAFVVPAAGIASGPDLAKSLQDHVKASIAPYKYPRAVEFVDALPKTLTGKLQRHRLKTPAAGLPA